jgi:SAM-dependent methyltransferase
MAREGSPIVSGPQNVSRSPIFAGNSNTALYPEVRAGGYSRVDGTVGFYTRVNALLTDFGPEAVVLDYGAGRGSFLEDPVSFRRDLRALRGRISAFIGVDIDESVLGNKALDQAYVVLPGQRLPLDDGSIDLVVSDFTFEHVVDPAWTTGELNRVLRPGGWICARTPNRWGYIGLGARAVPNELHVSILRRLQPTKKPEDTFPTSYKLNTPKDLKRWFPVSSYEHYVHATDSEPAYAGKSVLAARLTRLGFGLTPPSWRSMLNVFLHKVVPEAAPRQQ